MNPDALCYGTARVTVERGQIHKPRGYQRARGKIYPRHAAPPRKASWEDAVGWFDGAQNRLGIKPIRLTCPACGRRLLSKTSLGSDADYVEHYLTPHKPRRWWKKKNGQR